MRWSRTARVVAVVVALALVAVGCSDDDESGADADDSSVVDFEPQEPEEEYALPEEDLDGEVEAGTVVFHGVTDSRHLHQVSSAGGSPTALTLDGFDGVGGAAVAPDGETIAALAWAPGAVELATTLLVGTVDGGFEPVLTDESLDMWCVRWYPSGDRLLLTAFVEGEMNPALLTVGLDGSTTPVEVPDGRFDCAVPVDDQRVVLTYLGMDITLIGAAIVDTSTGEPDVLAEMIGCLLYGGVLSPSGDEIAVAATCEEPDESGIYAIDVDTGEADRVLAGEFGFPAWSPSGEWLTFGVYATPSVTSSTVWVVRSDGTGARQLTDTIGTQPAWVR
jgi:hypothetical protein